MHQPRLLLLALLVLARTMLAFAHPPSPADSASTLPTPDVHASKQRKILMMHYLCWYETPSIRGRWGAHWTGPNSKHDPATTDTAGLPNLWSHYHPLIGPLRFIRPRRARVPSPANETCRHRWR